MPKVGTPPESDDVVPGIYPFKMKNLKSRYNLKTKKYSVRTGSTYWYVTRKFVLLAWSSTYFYHALRLFKSV